MVHFVERSTAPVAPAPRLDTVDTAHAAHTAANRVPTLSEELCTAGVPTIIQVPSAPAQMDPASPASIAQAVVALLTPMVTEAVDQTVINGLDHLHKEQQLQALRIGQRSKLPP